jgi:hypothetical protein
MGQEAKMTCLLVLKERVMKDRVKTQACKTLR